MPLFKNALVIAALTITGTAVLASLAGPAGAAEPTATVQGQVLCVHYEDSTGHRVGPEVCIPWFLPVP
jgi:hypothetical protein